MGAVLHSGPTSLPRLGENGGAMACCRVKVQWTIEESRLLMQLLHMQGARYWSVIPSKLGGRCTHNSCQPRWGNYLDPTVDRAP